MIPPSVVAIDAAACMSPALTGFVAEHAGIIVGDFAGSVSGMSAGSGNAYRRRPRVLHDQGHMKEAPSNAVAAQFLASQGLHEIAESTLDLAAGDLAPESKIVCVEQAAEPLLRALAADRFMSSVESVLEWGRRLGVLEVDANVAVLLAMFIMAQQCGDCQIRAGQHTAGDHLDDITEIVIEVGAQRGDFDLEFLVSWREVGPHPDWRFSDSEDRGDPRSLEVVREMAVICDNPPSGERPSDQKTRRAGLSSLGLLVFAYRREEAEQDPYGLAKRALGELRRVINDEFVP